MWSNGNIVVDELPFHLSMYTFFMEHLFQSILEVVTLNEQIEQKSENKSKWF